MTQQLKGHTRNPKAEVSASTERQRRLIEEWLPIVEIGVESLRERTPMTPFPAPNRLHVWWARRPLVASRAAILASLLPHDADHEKFMHVLGIHGDPVESRRRIDEPNGQANDLRGRHTHTLVLSSIYHHMETSVGSIKPLAHARPFGFWTPLLEGEAFRLKLFGWDVTRLPTISIPWLG